LKIRVGFELVYDCPQPTPMILMLHIHPSRDADLLSPDILHTNPSIPVGDYVDGFGNRCSRAILPPGQTRFSSDTLVHDSGLPDAYSPDAVQHAVPELPPETLVYLLGSRYCETDRLNEIAWSLFGGTPLGWGRVAAICTFVHRHIVFGYQHARPTKSSWDAYGERQGVCRDYAHLAIAFCRCMNIPARYCAGYMGDIGIPYDPAPMDFSGWFEVYLGDRWHTFDARHNKPRIGRIAMGRGRDAADVALSTSFGPNILVSFKVISEEVA